jgi:hypothetical protein
MTMSSVSDSPDMIEEAVVGLPLDVQRLSTARGTVGLAATGWEGVAILAGEFGFPIYTEGEISLDTLVVAFQLEGGAGSWDGYEMSLDRAWFYTPGSEHSGIGLGGPGGKPPRFATISLPRSAPRTLRERQLEEGSSELGTQWVSSDHRVHGLRALATEALELAHSGDLSTDNANLIGRDIVDFIECLCIEPSREPIETTTARVRHLGVCLLPFSCAS